MKRKKGERGMGNGEEGKEGNGECRVKSEEWRRRTRRGASLLNVQPSMLNDRWGMGHGSLIFFTKR